MSFSCELIIVSYLIFKNILMEQSNKIILFEDRQIRRLWHDDQWYFNIVDIMSVLTDSENPRNYWSVLKNRLSKKEGLETLTVCKPLKFGTEDGKNRRMDAANTEGVLRLLMSVPSPKAEPFKVWLANVGKQFLDEAENPEIALDRIKEIYRAKGYSDEWIENRLKSIGVRKELTDEWKKRGVKENKDYAILTAQIAKGTFGLSPSEHSQLKGLEKQNLRDHMTNLELLFSAIGEEATRLYAINDDAQGFNENLDSAQSGGNAAGRALKAFEEDKKIKVVSSDNYLSLSTPPPPPSLSDEEEK